MLADALLSLDPASTDPNYWFRFRGWVMSGAARELAQRRLMAELTIGEVMTSWARTLVPTAALAAAVAAFVLIRATTPAPTQHVGLEELLVTDVPVETQPVFLSPDGAAGIVAFASDVY
jgi:hypothetical protein